MENWWRSRRETNIKHLQTSLTIYYTATQLSTFPNAHCKCCSSPFVTGPIGPVAVLPAQHLLVRAEETRPRFNSRSAKHTGDIVCALKLAAAKKRHKQKQTLDKLLMVNQRELEFDMTGMKAKRPRTRKQVGNIVVMYSLSH